MRFSRSALIVALCLTAPALAAQAPAANPSPSATTAVSEEDQRAALNKQEAEKAQQQVDENTARVLTNAEEAKKHADAIKAYEAAQAQHAAQVKAYEDAVAKWKADVAECQARKKNPCAKP